MKIDKYYRIISKDNLQPDVDCIAKCVDITQSDGEPSYHLSNIHLFKEVKPTWNAQRTNKVFIIRESNIGDHGDDGGHFTSEEIFIEESPEYFL